MIRTRRYKYIYNDGQTHELYNWEAEPGKFVNRAADSGLKRTRNQLRDQLFAYRPERNPFQR